MSPIVYEVIDFACGLTDAEGRVLAQTNGLALFTGTFRPQVRSPLSRYGIGGMREATSSRRTCHTTATRTRATSASSGR